MKERKRNMVGGIIGVESEVTLAMFLMDSGWDLTSYDVEHDAFVCTTYRAGRTDEAIEQEARIARIAIAMVMSLCAGFSVCPGFRYRVI